jgi:hypothetical protein
MPCRSARCHADCGIFRGYSRAVSKSIQDSSAVWAKFTHGQSFFRMYKNKKQPKPQSQPPAQESRNPLTKPMFTPPICLCCVTVPCDCLLLVQARRRSPQQHQRQAWERIVAIERSCCPFLAVPALCGMLFAGRVDFIQYFYFPVARIYVLGALPALFGEYHVIATKKEIISPPCWIVWNCFFQIVGNAF